jgi:hypothetical protein
MSLDETVVDGTLRSDGTVELDQKPNLAPGRVTVVLRPHTPAPPPQEDWWQFLQRSRRELEASGAVAAAPGRLVAVPAAKPPRTGSVRCPVHE